MKSQSQKLYTKINFYNSNFTITAVKKMSVSHGQGLEEAGTPHSKGKGSFFCDGRVLFSDCDDAYTNPYMW